jgi:hypothetical protein
VAIDVPPAARIPITVVNARARALRPAVSGKGLRKRDAACSSARRGPAERDDLDC